jgi:hypothetical protein
VEGLLLKPLATGHGQAFMSGKAYDHSVWYDTVWSMSFDIPVAGKYRFLDAQIGLHDGYTTSTTFDIKGDNVTLIGMHGVSNQPESVHVPIAGVQTLTIDVALYYQNAQTARFVLGNARLLT